MSSQRVVRAVCVSIVTLVCVFLVVTNVGASSFALFSQSQSEIESIAESGGQVAPAAPGATAITSHEAGDILVVGPTGAVTYHNGTHDGYWDVDPLGNDSQTLVYTATDRLDSDVCRPHRSNGHCVRQQIERLNLTTGETERLYATVDPQYEASEWHDVDRINDTHYVVADMYDDSVFIVDIQTQLVVWEWRAQSDFSLSGGGLYPKDWAHLNDVEVLDDGRLMVSLRNQDQVVFIDPDSGLQTDWTLGGEDDHERLYEQHNPDFIPAVNGGPAVLIADSENNRLVEYQRSSTGDWNRSWIWTDSTLQWPRDADRLPNGNTLVSDTQGGRVFEIAPNGSIVWELSLRGSYEAERLSTGDESAGGPSARSADLANRTDRTVPDDSGLLVTLRSTIERALPNKVVNGIANFGPGWFRFDDLLVGGVGLLATLGWLAAEWHWSSFVLQWPLRRRDR